jgi:hypothetical protein
MTSIYEKGIAARYLEVATINPLRGGLGLDVKHGGAGMSCER